MALTSVVAAAADGGPGRGVRRRRRASASCCSACSSARSTAALVVLTRVPDIVVTLAMSFVWAGCALLVLQRPGGGSADWLKDLVSGSVVQRVDPQGGGRAGRRRRGDLDPAPALASSACRSTPSAATSWRRSGAACRSVGRRSLAYAIAGLFAALGGLALTASTGHRHAGPRAVHAAERRRGRARRRQPGRRPRRPLRPDRRGASSCQLIRTDMTFLRLNTEPRDRGPGRHPHRRGHARQPHPAPADAGVTSVATRPRTRQPVAHGDRLAAPVPRPAAHPAPRPARLLVVVIELVRPGIVTPTGPASSSRAAVPLAILAGCQTLTMLTGGIDLSVGAVASMAGFVVATLSAARGSAVGIVVALVGRRARRARHRHRRRRLPRPPADHDPGHEPGRPRLGERLAAARWSRPASGVPPELRTLGRGTLLGDRSRTACSCSCRSRVLILLGLRRTGYGRLLYAIGDNPIAARLSGARAWQVLIVLYVISALLAGDRRVPRSRA